MAPSQLKQLKLSLRESGLVGPQPSRKKRRERAQTGVSAQHRIQRQAALSEIHERFNPFETKAPARNVKFAVTTRDSAGKYPGRGTIARPGVTKSLGEERRRETLLKDIRLKHKVGGIYDRRFGENDPTMTPEERAAERFARESQRRLKKESMFNLEEEEDEEFMLTHDGQFIQFDNVDGVVKGNFKSDSLEESDDEPSDDDDSRKRKRFSSLERGRDLEDGSVQEEDQPERKKSKAEVMKEVIAKSKLYKYERQKAKEDDDDLRAELDKGLPDLFEIMRGMKTPGPEFPNNDSALMNPDRAALLEGKDRDQVDIEYDRRLKQMTLEKRSQPTDRTKTDEEKAQEEAERLKTLEESRLRRMRGEGDESNSEGEAGSTNESYQDDAITFGLAPPDNHGNGLAELGVEDEDNFIIDEDLVETDSNASLSFLQSDEELSGHDTSLYESEEDEELADHISGYPIPNGHTNTENNHSHGNENLPYTYPCPETHESFLQILKGADVADLPTVIQRIRALHSSRLHADNKVKLNKFLIVLVEHVIHLANNEERPPFAILENILRHIHSMAKSNPDCAAKAFRAQLRDIATNRPLKLSAGDLIALTGISVTFPTSDHFHSVVTPANLTLTRYLGQSSVDSLSDLVKGAYVATLCINHQTHGKRYIPEFMNYCLNALCNLSPSEIENTSGSFLRRMPRSSLRLHTEKIVQYKKLQFWEALNSDASKDETEAVKLSLVATFVALLDLAADLWFTKAAAYEIFEPAYKILQGITELCNGIISSDVQVQLKASISKLRRLLADARSSRCPLLLHNHRPLAIKTSFPKFEEDFNPDKHYDPNRERAELAKLKAEHKRERKGAMRELRKDANFVARESLREKKERDAAYEKKYRRLIAEIQGEEGREAKAYEREKRLRQGKK